MQMQLKMDMFIFFSTKAVFIFTKVGLHKFDFFPRLSCFVYLNGSHCKLLSIY